MIRFALILAACWLSLAKAPANPPKIDRSITKEPVYQTKAPKYGLLVFGPEGKDRVWLVLDGDTLYVDRNGNGDLTEAGEKIAAEKKARPDPEEDGYWFDVGDLKVSGRTHKGLSVGFAPLKRFADGSLGRREDVKAFLAKDSRAYAVGIRVDAEVPGITGGGIGGRITFTAGSSDLTGVLQFAERPLEAPAVIFGGPLQVTFQDDLPTLRVGRETLLFLVVGTPGVGPGTFAMIDYQDTIPEGAKPIAELILPPANPGAPPTKKMFEIRERC